jgi:hypothetical protein
MKKSQHAHPHRPSKLVGRARPRGWKLRGAHEDQMHPWRGMRNHITWSPGRTFESLCVSVWLFARSAKQNWPLPLLPVRALPAWLLLCALLPSLPVRRPPELTSPGFQLFPRTHTLTGPDVKCKNTHGPRARTHTHTVQLPPALVRLTFFRDGILSGNAAAVGDVCSSQTREFYPFYRGMG